METTRQPEFTNPNKGIDRDKIMRSTLEIQHSWVSEIKSYEPKDGVIQTTALLLIQKLKHELKRAKLEPGDRHAYHSAICNARIVLYDSAGRPLTIEGEPAVAGVDKGGSAVTKPSARRKHASPKQAVAGDDGRGNASVAQPAA